jgi:hypothetical protein
MKRRVRKRQVHRRDLNPQLVAHLRRTRERHTTKATVERTVPIGLNLCLAARHVPDADFVYGSAKVLEQSTGAAAASVGTSDSEVQRVGGRCRDSCESAINCPVQIKG